MASLEGWNFTTKLHPRVSYFTPSLGNAPVYAMPKREERTRPTGQGRLLGRHLALRDFDDLNNILGPRMQCVSSRTCARRTYSRA